MTKVSIITFEEFDDFKKKYWEHELYKVERMDKYLAMFRKKHIMPFKIDPWDEIDIYKKLLNKIKDQDLNKYKKIHKGTPFYWIGWNSFLIKNYNQAIFYMDAALAEDKKNHTKTKISPYDNKAHPLWFLSGAAMFFRLQSKDYRKIYDRGYSRAPELFDLVKDELDSFHPVNSSKKISLDNFINLFVDKLIIEDNTAIITTLYTFIFEKEDIFEMIRSRGMYGGTIEPMILHLFKGALIFETLIKNKYNGTECTNAKNTLGCILREPQTQRRYNYTFQSGECAASSLEDIFTYINNNDDDSVETAFHVACKIRNTTAHNLLWNDIFTMANYENLYQKILNAIFYVLKRDYKL